MAHLVRPGRNRDARTAALAARNELDEQAGARGALQAGGPCDGDARRWPPRRSFAQPEATPCMRAAMAAAAIGGLAEVELEANHTHRRASAGAFRKARVVDFPRGGFASANPVSLLRGGRLR